MQFFTDEKLERQVAHDEYDQYWREYRATLGLDLLRINGGMLDESWFPEGSQEIHLHDARMTGLHANGADRVLSLKIDRYGQPRSVQLQYFNVSQISELTPSMLADKPESDLMFHETTVDIEGQLIHEMLFASGDTFRVRFQLLAITVLDTDPAVDPLVATPWQRKVLGAGMIALGSLMACAAIETYLTMRDDMDRNAALSCGGIALLLMIPGGVIGFREYLPKFTIRAFRLIFGILGVFAGTIMLVWTGYNAMVERLPDFRGKALRGVMFSITMIGVGIGMAWGAIRRDRD